MTGFLEVLAVLLLAGNVAAVALRRRRRIRAVWALEEAESGWPAQLLDPPPLDCAPIARIAPRMVVTRDMLTVIPGDMVAAMAYQAHRAEASAAWSAATRAPQDGNILDDLERARHVVATSRYRPDSVDVLSWGTHRRLYSEPLEADDGD